MIGPSDNSTDGSPAQPQSAAHVRRSSMGMDWILIGAVIALVLYGLLMVYSASPQFAINNGKEPDYYLNRQILWVGVGMVALFVASRIDYHKLRRLTVLMMIGTILLLIGVVLIGDTTLNANRSIFQGSVRPSELAKLVTIIYVSVWLYAKREVLNDITLGLVPLMVILGLTGGLILIQPDLSAAITVIVLGGILFFLANGEWRQIVLVIGVSLLVGWAVVNVYPTGTKRINDYVAGLRDPLKASYHVRRSLEAIINGGFIGQGIGQGRTKVTGLPVQITDSIFAVIAEEGGLVGAAMVIAIYLLLLWRGLAIAARAPDQLGSLLASGITVWIVVEAMLNMAVMVNLLPQAGNALPFISYGGSQMLVNLTGIGILLNVDKASRTAARSAGAGGSRGGSNGGNIFGTVVDLRWRNRRGRVSRSGRPASPWQSR